MGEKLRLPMDDSKLDDSELELLRALRGSPDSRLDELADAVGLPRTNFGRRLSGRIQEPISDFVADGLVEDHQGRYRLSPDGRRTVVERAGGRTR
jgi:DNA-binding IclR family transcriptional regulator